MENSTSHPLQICLSASKESNKLVSASKASYKDRKHAEEIYLSVVLKYTSGLAHLPYELRFMSPNPILVSQQFLDEIKEFHQALTLALNHIVRRWFSDKEAAFPTRMPLEPHEEELLQVFRSRSHGIGILPVWLLTGQWVSEQNKKNAMHFYEGHQGNWRPDLLLPLDGQESFKICEINARYPFNGIDLAGLFYQALANPDIKPPFLDPAADGDRLFDSIFAMFNPDQPIHFLQSKAFIETRKNVMTAFMDFEERRTAMRPRAVTPEKLRLVRDSTSKTGFALYCTSDQLGSLPSVQQNGETLEKVSQVGLQLTGNEYQPLDPEIRHHLGIYGVNDVRSMLLVQDKRLLGILHQELDGLVKKHDVLTEEQAELLRRRVIPTIIPGSKELQQLLSQHRKGTISKDHYLLKPVRGSRGEGIVFGDELNDFEWEAILNDLQNPGICPERTLYVIQPVVTQVEKELFLDEDVGQQRCQLVGSYHAVNGEFVGLGAWRVVNSSQRTCNMATGRAWKLGSVVLRE